MKEFSESIIKNSLLQHLIPIYLLKEILIGYQMLQTCYRSPTFQTRFTQNSCDPTGHMQTSIPNRKSTQCNNQSIQGLLRREEGSRRSTHRVGVESTGCESCAETVERRLPVRLRTPPHQLHESLHNHTIDILPACRKT